MGGYRPSELRIWQGKSKICLNLSQAHQKVLLVKVKEAGKGVYCINLTYKNAIKLQDHLNTMIGRIESRRNKNGVHEIYKDWKRGSLQRLSERSRNSYYRAEFTG